MQAHCGAGGCKHLLWLLSTHQWLDSFLACEPGPEPSHPACLPVQVCGLRWSPDDRELASGGNDNQLFVWHQQVGCPWCSRGAARVMAGWHTARPSTAWPHCAMRCCALPPPGAHVGASVIPSHPRSRQTRCCGSASTRRQSRPSLGRHTSTACWSAAAALPTAAYASGTRPQGRACSASTPAARYGRLDGLEPSLAVWDLPTSCTGNSAVQSINHRLNSAVTPRRCATCRGPRM